eukprot:Hpha_TRINITY_DN3954_c0_g1::TRINITY_DN3954_c0_g1_i1::g.18026::m.18026
MSGDPHAGWFHWMNSEQQGSAIGGAAGSVGGRAAACFLPIFGDLGALGGGGVGAVLGSTLGGTIGSAMGTPPDPKAVKLAALERAHKFNAVDKKTYKAAKARLTGK